MASKTVAKLASAADWPLLPPAAHVFPTLQRFKIAPRRNPNIPPGHKGFVPLLVRAGSIQTLYHDYGVMVYAGSTVAQSRVIARHLKALNEDGATLPDLTSVQIANAEIGKYSKYRIPTEDRHVEQGVKVEDGVLSSGAILELGSQAAGRWMDDAIASANRDYPNLRLNYFRESSIHINRGLFTRGIIHQTVNGPRRLNVDAHIMVHKKSGGFTMGIELYTVGTSTYVGKMRVNLSAFGGENDQVFTEKETDMILDSVPSSTISTQSAVRSATSNLWALERGVWAARVDSELYPLVQHASKLKSEGEDPAESESKGNSKIKSKSGPKTDPKINTNNNTKSDLKNNSKSDSKSNLENDAKIDPKKDLEGESKNDLGSDLKSDLESESKNDSQSDSKNDLENGFKERFQGRLGE